MIELEIPVVAVVNHLGERLLITVDQYRSGQWQLWEEREVFVPSQDPATTAPDPPDPSPEPSQRRRRRNQDIAER